jgi:hypothetical protein
MVQLNPVFQLVEQGDLPSDQNKILVGLTEARDHFGLLVPRELPALGVLAVDRASAALFKSLQKPRQLSDKNLDQIEIARLVLDGILNVEWKGRYLTGPSACACLFTRRLKSPSPVGPLSALSFTALKLIQDTPLEDPQAISSWLYGYNCIPMSPSWARRFSSPEDVTHLLGLQTGGAVEAILNSGNYTHHQVVGWHSWQSMTNEWKRDDDRPTYKLYISPHPNDLAEMLPAIVQCFVNTQVPAFKLGIDGFGLLRPDKLIAYFSTYDALEETARSLEKVISGYPVQGVPFTAALTKNGILSWGIDPPVSGQIPGWRGIESWRVWIANLLARAILRAKALGDRTMEPWQYALLRLRLEGVKIQTWLPAVSMWDQA